jgi:hypothetical protein
LGVGEPTRPQLRTERFWARRGSALGFGSVFRKRVAVNEEDGELAWEEN